MFYYSVLEKGQKLHAILPHSDLQSFPEQLTSDQRTEAQTQLLEPVPSAMKGWSGQGGSGSSGGGSALPREPTSLLLGGTLGTWPQSHLLYAVEWKRVYVVVL